MRRISRSHSIATGYSRRSPGPLKQAIGSICPARPNELPSLNPGEALPQDPGRWRSASQPWLDHSELTRTVSKNSAKTRVSRRCSPSRRRRPGRARRVARARPHYLTHYITRSLLEAGGCRPRLHPDREEPSMDTDTTPWQLRTVLDPFMTLSVAASLTERVLLGASTLVAPQYSPLLLARSLTGVDVVRGGRLITGLGTGWSPEEYQGVGVPWQERGAPRGRVIASVARGRSRWRHRANGAGRGSQPASSDTSSTY
ncbi:LLM class flavin-dependent oxidoreductase [Streptomyces parvus]|uniref:LLM class flavin-dependent oxidoreductase n=2 Tax=Streptomyces parvus TaxID=66428 RepID=UPI0027E41D16|nr:LLM class flavin-dependent oxidoreductase [Streptomyces parvus]